MSRLAERTSSVARGLGGYGLRCGVVVVVVAVAGLVAVGEALGARTYEYDVTIAATSTGDHFVVEPGYPGVPTYSGSVSASFSFVFPVVFTVDAKAHTVDAESMASSSGSGTNSFTLTSMEGSQTNTCTIPAGSHFTAAGNLTDTWNIRSRHTGPMLFLLSAAFNSAIYPCSPSTIGTITIGTVTVPGLALNPAGYPGCSAGNSPYISIPISDLGKQHVTTKFDPGPLKCQATRLSANYTAHVRYTITLDLVDNTAKVHIGSARVSTSERLKRLARELRPQVEQLVKEKQQLDAELPGERTRFDQATAALAAVEKQIAPLPGEVDQTQTFVNAITAAEHGSPKEAEVQARDSLDRAMARLQIQIIEADLAGDAAGAKSLQSHFNIDLRQLNNLEKALAGKEQKADDLSNKWLARLRVLKDQLFGLRRQEAQAEHERWVSGDELQRSLARAATVDDQLVALGAKLSALDFDIESVSVTADGEKVYEAELNGPAARLLRLDSELAAMKSVLDELESQRLASKKQFLDAEKESIAALAKVADTIMSVAYKKAGVDFVYNGYDVIRAAGKGGLVGAAAETLKKVAEALVTEYSDRGPGKYGSPGATEFDHEYDLKLKDAFGADKLLKIGRTRIVKEAVTKPLKDKLNQAYLSKLFNKLYPDVHLPQGGAPVPAPPKNVADAFRSFIKSFSNKQAHLENLKKGITKPWSSLKNAKSVGGDVVGKLLIDVSKNLAKAYFDAQEQEAWVAYFEKEIVARSYYPFWQMASSEYWEAYDAYNGLLDEKAALLKGYDAETNARTTLDEKFSKNATLRFTITVVRAAGTTGTVDLGVLVAGKSATHAGGYKYTIGAKHLKEGHKGLGLEIQAR